MRAVLVFPFRDDSVGSREQAFNKTVSLLRVMYDWCAILTVDSGHSRFNRAATRNLGVQEAIKRGADVVVLCDADSIPERIPLVEAIHAASDDRFHYPFDQVWAMSPKITPTIGKKNLRQLENRAISRSGRSEGGIWVFKPEIWTKIGGQDPRLAGWGCEDRSFLSVTHTLVGEPVFHEGVLLCLHHGRIAEETWLPGDVELMIRYQAALGDPKTTREIIDERLDSFGSLDGSTKERGPVVRVLP